MELVWGLVESIDDPIYAQRVQVRIYGYYDDLNADELPWCQVVRSPSDALTFNVGKQYHNLVPGSQVLCAWLDKNFQQPIVIGQVPRIDDCNENTDMKVQKIMTQHGHEIVVDDKGISITDSRKNNITMNTDGISISAKLDMYNKGKSEEEFTTKNINIDNEFNITTNNLNITATNCNIKCSGETMIDASGVSIKNIKGPNQFCKIPACLFTGAPHISPSTDQ